MLEDTRQTSECRWILGCVSLVTKASHSSFHNIKNSTIIIYNEWYNINVNINRNNNSYHVRYKTATMQKVEHHDLWFMIHTIWNSDHHSPASVTPPLIVQDVRQPPIHQVTHTALDPWRVLLQPKSTLSEATSHKSHVHWKEATKNGLEQTSENSSEQWDTGRGLYKLSWCRLHGQWSLQILVPKVPWAAQTWRRRKHQLEVEESVQRFRGETSWS